MFYRTGTLALVGLALAVGSAKAFDTLKTSKGTISGDVIKMTKTEVTIEKSGVEEIVPVNSINSISFAAESPRLRSGRTAILSGQYEDALETLKSVKPDSLIGPFVKQEYAFQKAYAATQIALASNTKISEAASEMFLFWKKSPDNWHYYQACELIGDLLVATGQSDKSRTYYAELAKAPWNDYKMRASVAIGRALLVEGKSEDALKMFEKVLAIKASDDLAAHQHLEATLGKARCLPLDRADEAVKLANQVIQRAHPEQSGLLAQAYNALGSAHRVAGRKKDALMAFLHVDVLYFTSPKEHIEALQNLYVLWQEVLKPDRARDAAEKLKNRYRMAPKAP